MAPDDPSNPAIDWDPETARTSLNATVVATAEPITAPHDVAPLATGLELEIAKARDEGYRKGFADGQADAVGAVALTFTEEGLTAEETKNILLRAEGKLTRI